VSDTSDYPRPDYKISVDGAPIDQDLQAALRTITVDDVMDGASVAKVKFRDEASMLSGEDKYAKKLKVGAELKVELGYVGGKLKEVFKGEITGWQGAFTRRGGQTLTICAKDRFHRLRRSRRQKTYLELKDSEAVSESISAAGLSPQVEATPIKQDSILQWNQTDADFVLERAGLFGFEVYVDDKKVVFRKPKLDAAKVAKLEWHKDLHRFETSISLTSQQKEVKVTAWNMKEKTAIEAKAKKGDERSLMGGTIPGADQVAGVDSSQPNWFTTTPAKTQDEVDAYAKGSFQKRAERFLRGEGLCVGNPDIRRGTVVELEGLGNFLSGPYYVRQAIHSLLPGSGYSTTFRVVRTAVQKPAAPPPPPEQPPIEREEAAVEPESESLQFEVANDAGAPLGGSPYVLTSPDGKREAGELSSDGKVEIEFEGE